MKRILAWVGLAYMALLLGAQMYFLFGGGELLYGWWGLLFCPACGGAFALAVYKRRQGEWTAAKALVLEIVSAVCFALFLAAGVRGLLSNF